MNEIRVAILMGSASDADTMQKTCEMLERFDLPYACRVLSAHRTPKHVIQFVAEAERAGCQAFVCAAGLAAHLAGVVAAHTLKPVIGVPMSGGPLSGFDALLSTVQMPKGTPVATVAVGSAGATNAALLCVRILALSDADLRKRLEGFAVDLEKEVLESDRKLQQR